MSPECSSLAPSKAAPVCVSSSPALRNVRSSHRPASPRVPAAQVSSGSVSVPSGGLLLPPSLPPSTPAHTCTTAMSSVSTSPPAVTTASASSPPLQTHKASTAWRVGGAPGSRLLPLTPVRREGRVLLLLRPDRREGRVLPGKLTWILRVRLYSSRTAEPLRLYWAYE